MCLHAMFVTEERRGDTSCENRLWVGHFEIRSKRKFTRITSDAGFDRRPNVLCLCVSKHISVRPMVIVVVVVVVVVVGK